MNKASTASTKCRIDVEVLQPQFERVLTQSVADFERRFPLFDTSNITIATQYHLHRTARYSYRGPLNLIPGHEILLDPERIMVKHWDRSEAETERAVSVAQRAVTYGLVGALTRNFFKHKAAHSVLSTAILNATGTEFRTDFPLVGWNANIKRHDPEADALTTRRHVIRHVLDQALNRTTETGFHSAVLTTFETAYSSRGALLALDDLTLINSDPAWKTMLKTTTAVGRGLGQDLGDRVLELVGRSNHDGGFK